MIDPQWDDLKLVRTIAEAGGLAAAGAALGLDQSTVYRRLGALEKSLGVPLFERHRTGYVATATGEEMIALAERFGQELAEFGRRLEGKAIAVRGEIRIATADSLLAHLLTPLLARFQAAHPEITLDAVIGNPALNLSRRDADIAIRATDHPPEALVGRRIGTIAWALYGLGTVDPAAANWVTLGEEMAGLKVVRWTRAHVPPERLVFRANTVLGIACAIEAGIGIGYLPCFIGDATLALRRLSEPEPDFSAGLWLLTHADLRHSPRIRLFMDFMAGELHRLKALIEGEPVSSVFRE